MAEVQKILHQVEEELIPILQQGLTASITIHCGQSQSVIEINRKLTIKRKNQSNPPSTPGWENHRS